MGNLSQIRKICFYAHKGTEVLQNASEFGHECLSKAHYSSKISAWKETQASWFLVRTRFWPFFVAVSGSGGQSLGAVQAFHSTILMHLSNNAIWVPSKWAWTLRTDVVTTQPGPVPNMREGLQKRERSCTQKATVYFKVRNLDLVLNSWKVLCWDETYLGVPFRDDHGDSAGIELEGGQF